MSQNRVPGAAFLVVATFLLWLCGCGVPAPEDRNAGPPLVGVNLEGLPARKDLDRVRTETGFSPDVVGFYLQWPSDPAEPPPPGLASSLEDISAAGALPMVTWEPMFLANGSETAVPGTEILAGRWDAYLESTGRRLASAPGPVLIRFAHEMNIDRYHWGGPLEAFTASSPPLYRSMFGYVERAVRAAGASNTLWIFCPNVESVPDPASVASAAWNTMEAYFPGTDLVDIAGLDGYNWGDTRTRAKHGWDSSWQRFSDLFGPALADIRSIVGTMPVLIGETASARSGGDRAAWVSEAGANLRSMGFCGIVWFHLHKEEDWKLTASEGRSLRGSGERTDPRAWAGRLLKRRNAY